MPYRTQEFWNAAVGAFSVGILFILVAWLAWEVRNRHQMENLLNDCQVSRIALTEQMKSLRLDIKRRKRRR